MKDQLKPIIKTVLNDKNYDINLEIYNKEYINISEVSKENLKNKFKIFITLDINNMTSNEELKTLTLAVANWMQENEVYGNGIFRKKDDNNEIIFTLSLEAERGKEIIIK